MDLIYQKRGTGKTCKLIKLSSQAGIPIAYCGQNAEYILRLSERLGCVIPNPVPVMEVRNAGYPKVYVDDADCVLGALLGVDIAGLSFNLIPDFS